VLDLDAGVATDAREPHLPERRLDLGAPYDVRCRHRSVLAAHHEIAAHALGGELAVRMLDLERARLAHAQVPVLQLDLGRAADARERDVAVARAELQPAADALDAHAAVAHLERRVVGDALERHAVEGSRDVGRRDLGQLDLAVLAPDLHRGAFRRLDLEMRLEAHVVAPSELVAVGRDLHQVRVSRELELDAIGERLRLLLRRQEHHLAQPDLHDAGRALRDAHAAEGVLDLEPERARRHGPLARRLEAPRGPVEAPAHHAAALGADVDVLADVPRGLDARREEDDQDQEGDLACAHVTTSRKSGGWRDRRARARPTARA
jgi:hypothetical protein